MTDTLRLLERLTEKVQRAYLIQKNLEASDWTEMLAIASEASAHIADERHSGFGVFGGLDGGVKNEDRAMWAQACIDTFRREAGAGMSDYEALKDLISDLGHWAMSRADFGPEREGLCKEFVDESEADIFVAGVQAGLGMWSAEARHYDDDPGANDSWVCIELTPENREQLLALQPDKIDVTKEETPSEEEEG